MSHFENINPINKHTSESSEYVNNSELERSVKIIDTLSKSNDILKSQAPLVEKKKKEKK